MNILILNWRDLKNPLSGGAERVTFQHAKAWVKKGHSVTWFTSRFTGSKSSETTDGITFVRRGSGIGVYVFAPFFYLFSGNKFDLVVDEIHGLPFFTPLYVKEKKVAFIHEVAGEIWDYMYPFPLNILGRCIEFCYFFFYKKIPFWTDALSTVKELEKKGIPQKNCIVIPCPLENKVEKTIAKKSKNPTFIFISRLVPMKGIENIISAFIFIQKKIPLATLFIVGNGDKKYVQELKKIIKNNNIEKNVSFEGFVSEKKKLSLLRKSHILLHASMKEGWGLVVVEAASQSTPSVVYDVPGLRDSVRNGKTGIVLAVNSPREMAEQSLLLLKDRIRYKTYQQNCLLFARSLSRVKITNQSTEFLEKYEKYNKMVYQL